VSVAMKKRCASVAAVVLHPYGEHSCESLRSAFQHDVSGRVFTMIWTPRDAMRIWLDGHGALNLHTDHSAPAPEPVLVAAAKLMANEQYNGLSSGIGKATVVGLLRAFNMSGYPMDEESWLQAFFAAGGSFRHGQSVSKLIREMRSGVSHRVETRQHRANIVEILRESVRDDQA
jgi:hypothetical protein